MGESVKWDYLVRKTDAEHLELFLKSAGAKGWELVNVVVAGPEWVAVCKAPAGVASAF